MSRPNRMAEAAAAVRAAHHRLEGGVIFDDPVAIHLTSWGWRLGTRSRVLYHVIADGLLRPLRPMRGQVLARSRYAEERLDAALARGVRKYVILAAGFDSFAVRRGDSAEALTVFELDHAGTQQLKRQRLAALQTPYPHNLVTLPIDFERERISDVLTRSRFDATQPAFFSWLGTVPYLTPEAVTATLTDLAATQAPGSELVLDYADAVVAPEEQATVDKLVRFAERRGEPLRTQFAVDDLARTVTAAGWRMLDDVSLATWRADLYRQPSLAVLRPLGAARMVHLGLG